MVVVVEGKISERSIIRLKIKTFDIEADGFLDGEKAATTIHCICVTDYQTGHVRTYTDALPGYPSLAEGLADLQDSDVLVGHNILGYDLRMLEKFFGFVYRGQVRDTIVLSRMGYTDLLGKDLRVTRKKIKEFPESLTGKHSLRAWGYRIGVHKGHVNDTEDYSVCTQEMLDYCAQDVVVNDELFKFFRDRWVGTLDPMDGEWNAVSVEMDFVRALIEQNEAGWLIDTGKAEELIDVLQHELKTLQEGLADLFPPFIVPPSNPQYEWTVPEGLEHAIVWEPSQHDQWYNPGKYALKTKLKVIPFNPNSSAMVIHHLSRKYNWRPKKFTPKGKPAFGSKVIESLPYEEAAALVRVGMISDRLSSMLGNSGFITLLHEDGRVRGRVNHCGAVTHRCTHSSPNSANITGNKAEYGKEIRDLFIAPEGYVVVGADASSLELRMLGNRMARFDGGKYANEVVDGDVHVLNATTAGLYQLHEPLPGESQEDFIERIRNAYAKSMIYAMNYGAGDKKLGRTVEPPGSNWTDKEATAAGKKVRGLLLKGLPALEKTISNLQAGYRKDGSQFIVGLDGRLASNRSRHQALNTQLQMDGAVVMKWATVLCRAEAIKRWGRPGKTALWCMVGHIHDEFQFQVREDIAHEFGRVAVESIRRAGKLLNTICPLDGESKIGRSWRFTH